jgi:hypothetical protein
VILLVSGRKLETSGVCDGPAAVTGAGALAGGR